MSLTPTATRTGSYSVRYDWAGTAPFDVWRDGVKILSGTDLTTCTVQTTDGTSNPLPAVEITDATDTEYAASLQYSPLVKFQWRGQADASYYVVEQYIDLAWTALAMIKENGSGYYSFQSQAQTDAATVDFRVIPYDARGYDGLPLTITHSVVCNPDPPPIGYSYSAGTGLLTIQGA